MLIISDQELNTLINTEEFENPYDQMHSTEEVTAASEEQVAFSDQLANLAGELKQTVIGLKENLGRFKL